MINQKEIDRRKKISNTLKGRKNTWGSKISNSLKGKKLSIRHKKKLSLAKKGKKWTSKRRIQMSKFDRSKTGMSGKNHSEETKRKIKEVNSNPEQIIIHHINGDHYDDRPENRMVVTKQEHIKIHIIQGDICGSGENWNKRKVK